MSSPTAAAASSAWRSRRGTTLRQPQIPTALSPAVATRAATAAHPAREAGMTSAFQIPPSPRSVSGSDRRPSARAAKASTPRGSLSAEFPCSAPATIQGALTARAPRTTRRERLSAARPRPATQASAKIAASTPPAALPAARASHSTIAGIVALAGPGTSCGVVQPGQRRVGEEQRPVPDPETLGHVRVPDVEGGRRELRRQVVRGHESPRTRAGESPGPRGAAPSPATARAPARRGGRPPRPRAPPAGAPSPAPGSRTGRRGRGRRPCRSSGRSPGRSTGHRMTRLSTHGQARATRSLLALTNHLLPVRLAGREGIPRLVAPSTRKANARAPRAEIRHPGSYSHRCDG